MSQFLLYCVSTYVCTVGITWRKARHQSGCTQNARSPPISNNTWFLRIIGWQHTVEKHTINHETRYMAFRMTYTISQLSLAVQTQPEKYQMECLMIRWVISSSEAGYPVSPYTFL